MTFFSDRDGPATASPPSPELTLAAWRGLVAVMRRRVESDAVAKEFPARCPDDGQVCGTDTATMEDEWGSLVPGLDLPLRADKLPPTAIAMDAVEFVAHRVSTPQVSGWHDYFSHTHLRFDDRAGALASLAADVNDVLRRNGVALRLTDDGRAERTGPAVVAASLHAWDRRTGDDTLDGLLVLR